MLKMVSRSELSPKKQNITRLIAVAVALLFAAVVMIFMKFNPISVYSQLIEGSLSTDIAFKNTVSKAIPLIILSLGVSVAFKMKFWNIGAEGQFYMGAYGATVVAFAFPNLSPIILLPLMFISAFIFGGLWALIAAVLKAKFSTSETLVTLMLNYVAINWILYLENGPLGNESKRIPSYSENGILPKLGGINIGWVIALILIVLVYILLSKTKLGYEVSVLGESEATARYAGMNVTKITVLAITISGGICGLAGVIQASAETNSALSSQLSCGLGFTAVITTWLARLSAPAILIVSFLFSMLIQGSATLQIELGMSKYTAEIIQGIIIFFVLASEFFVQYKIVRTSKKPKEAK